MFLTLFGSVPPGGAFNKLRANEKNKIDTILERYLEGYSATEHKTEYVKLMIMSKIIVKIWVGNVETGRRVDANDGDALRRVVRTIVSLPKCIF